MTCWCAAQMARIAAPKVKVVADSTVLYFKKHDNSSIQKHIYMYEINDGPKSVRMEGTVSMLVN